MNRNRATEDQLRAALHTVADDVQPESPHYRAMLGRYRRRERRRRLLLAVVVTVVFAASVLVALWIINRSSTNTTFYSPGASAARNRTAPLVPVLGTASGPRRVTLTRRDVT